MLLREPGCLATLTQWQDQWEPPDQTDIGRGESDGFKFVSFCSQWYVKRQSSPSLSECNSVVIPKSFKRTDKDIIFFKKKYPKSVTVVTYISLNVFPVLNHYCVSIQPASVMNALRVWTQVFLELDRKQLCLCKRTGVLMWSSKTSVLFFSRTQVFKDQYFTGSVRQKEKKTH